MTIQGDEQNHRNEIRVSPAQEPQPQTAPSLRRWLYAIPVTLAVVFVAVLLTVRLAPGAAPALRTVPADLLPGSPLPVPGTCTHPEHPTFHEVDCVASRGHLVRFVYDTRERVITYTSYPLDGVTLGDLILAWGTPDSYLYHYSYGTVGVFWGVKSALTSSSLRVTSPVVLVSHYRNAASLPAGRCAWRGLVSTESTDCSGRAGSTPIPSAAQK
jgi:hypothetical protein